MQCIELCGICPTLSSTLFHLELFLRDRGLERIDLSHQSPADGKEKSNPIKSPLE